MMFCFLKRIGHSLADDLHQFAVRQSKLGGYVRQGASYVLTRSVVKGD